MCEMNTINPLIGEIIDIVKEAGKIILYAERDDSMISEKSGHANFVTTYDQKVQQVLKKELIRVMPEAAFVGEEEAEHADISKGYAFIVDPIDGTTNFIKDYKASAISVGITKDGQGIGGVIYNPYLDEVFYAWRGEGAYLNGKQIHVSRQPLSNGIIIFGTAPYYEELSKKSFEMAFDYLKKGLDVRRSGSAALDLCSIAAGRAEVFFELRLQPWDFAAGSVIVTEAGGKITTVEGCAITLDQPCSVVASNGLCE